MAGDEDRSEPPPGWPSEAEIKAEVDDLFAMYEDMNAMSSILDAVQREQAAEERQGEPDQQGRLDRAAQKASAPDDLGLPEISGGTDRPARMLRLLHAKNRYNAAFSILVNDHDVTQLERMQTVGAEIIALARSLGPDFQHEETKKVELLSFAAAGFLKVREEIGQGRGAAAAKSFSDQVRKRAAAVPAAAAELAAGIVSERPDNETRIALAAAGGDIEKIRTILKDPALPIGDRHYAAILGANEALRDADFDRSLTYAEIEVDLAAQLTDRGADLRTAEHALAAVGLPGPATYVGTILNLLQTLARDGGREPEALQGPLIDRIAALAEGARGMLMARLFEFRTDLQPLAAVRPELAAEFTALASELRSDPDTLAALRAADSPPAVSAGRAEWARARKLRASRELDVLIEQIRAEAGFAGFLRRLGPAQLRGLAASGPAVMLVCPDGAGFRHLGGAITPFAIVVTEQEIRAIRLDVDLAVLDDYAARWRAAIEGLSTRPPARPTVSRVREMAAELVEILSLVWHDVVAPVLAAAGLAIAAAADGQWPRLWWITEGPLHELPLHAAQCQLPGCRRGGCGATLDHVASSYLPSLRTLAHARDRAAGAAVPAAGGRLPGQGRALLVAADDEELPGAEAEARGAAASLGRTGWTPDLLVGPAATRTAVLAGLAEAGWAHFGCHATSDPQEPSGGLLHLPTGEVLTVREVSAGQPEEARLAFLAACSTARAPDRLPGEAIHLSNAFLLAGFSSAVGTLWEIDSADASAVTSSFYDRVTGAPPQSSALALHHAVRVLRAQQPNNPYAWAAYVHSGA